jgi:hypothetical protein
VVRSPSDNPPDTARRLDALLRDLGPWLRRGGRPAEPLPRLPTGIADLDRLLGGGFPRGRLSEIAGPLSSGRTSLALCLMARATRAGEMVAVIDAADAFDPASAEAAGSRLDRVLWARAPGRREALVGAERLLEAHGFALVLLDLSPAAPQPSVASAPQGRRPRSEAQPSVASAPQGRRPRSEAQPSVASAPQGRRPRSEAQPSVASAPQGRRPRSEAQPSVASADWLRLARAAAGTGTALIALSAQRVAGAHAELALELRATRAHFTGTPALLEGLEIEAVLVRHTSAPGHRNARVRLHSAAAA